MVTHILNSILIIILFFPLFSKGESRFECTAGVISKFYFGQNLIEKSTYCFNNNKNILYSRNCLDQNCKAFKSKKRFQLKDLYSEYGSPGFKLCHEIGGLPEIISFDVNKESYKLDRCLFPDKSYVDTGSLMEFYIK